MKSCPRVLVTGASRGLGRGVAERLAATGYSVAIHYANNAQAAASTLDICKQAAILPSQQFLTVGGDVSRREDRGRIVEQLEQAWGGIDALVNNAGIAPRIRADITEASEESFDEVMGVNLKGPYFLSQSIVNQWLARPGQSNIASGYKLIFISSLSATTASINRGDYCISKAGLAMAAQLFAVRLADSGIQVMEIRPGIMATDMTAGVKEKYDKVLAEGIVPQKRWGQPSDVGLAVEAVLAGAFPFSTGEVINVDGGFHLRRL